MNQRPRIGFIAMSGVRVVNERLVAAGMTMPEVVARVKTVAALPSLSLLTLAGLTPDTFDVSYLEIADIRGVTELPGPFDLVAISSFSAQIDEAYELADRYRAAGVPVVLGGLHVTAEPDEAAEHATAVVVGEGEPLWRALLADFAGGRLKARYQSPPGRHFDLADAPLPRYDLLNAPRYNRFPVQASRGCPHQCDFCASSILLTPGYSVKPAERVIAEIREIKRLARRPFIEFADDNSFASRGPARRLFEALREERVHWFTETDISIATTPTCCA